MAWHDWVAISEWISLHYGRTQMEMMNSTDYLGVDEFGENRTVTGAVPTALRTDPVYISVYVNGMYFVFIYIIPFGSLAVFNLLIFLAIRKRHCSAHSSDVLSFPSA